MEISLFIISCALISLLSFLYGKTYQMKKIRAAKIDGLKETIDKVDNIIFKIENKDGLENSLDVSILEWSLNMAVEEEEYEEAAHLRDLIEKIKSNNANKK